MRWFLETNKHLEELIFTQMRRNECEGGDKGDSRIFISHELLRIFHK